MDLAFECVNADRIRLSGRGARRGELVSRRTSFPRLFPPLSISIPNSRHETSKESVRRGTKGDPTDKADPHGGRPFFSRVNPPISQPFIPVRFSSSFSASFLLLRFSRRARPCSSLLPWSPWLENPTRWWSIVPLETLIPPTLLRLILN